MSITKSVLVPVSLCVSKISRWMKIPLYERKPQILKYLHVPVIVFIVLMVVCLKPLILKMFWT